MSSINELFIISIILTNLILLGASRLTILIRIVAAQGIFLGVLPLIMRDGYWTWRLIILAVTAGILKGAVFPLLIGRALREANVRREVEPFIGFNLSVFAGILALVCSFWLSSRLPLFGEVLSRLTLPAAFFTIFTGFFLIVARRKAISQVLGYLVLENGIYIFGTSLGQEIPLAVELGILLDVFVGVFVMGIAIFHISREFDHLDVDRLTTLKDWTP